MACHTQAYFPDGNAQIDQAGGDDMTKNWPTRDAEDFCLT